MDAHTQNIGGLAGQQGDSPLAQGAQADVGNTLVFLLVKIFSAVEEAMGEDMASPAPSLGKRGAAPS